MFALTVTIIIALAVAGCTTSYLLTWDSELTARMKRVNDSWLRAERVIVRVSIAIIIIITALLVWGVVDLTIHP